MSCKSCRHFKVDYVSEHCFKCARLDRNDNYVSKSWAPRWEIICDNIKYCDIASERKVTVKTIRRNIGESTDLIKILKAYAMLDAWVCEHGYKVKASDFGNAFTISFDEQYIAIPVSKSFNPLIVYMTEEGAKKTADALNTSELILE